MKNIRAPVREIIALPNKNFKKRKNFSSLLIKYTSGKNINKYK